MMKKAVFHNSAQLFCKREKCDEKMKKMILNPKRDTITLCLPTDWVGKPIVCILKSPYELEEDEEMVSKVSEAALCYHVRKRRKYKKPIPLRRKRRPKQRRRRS